MANCQCHECVRPRPLLIYSMSARGLERENCSRNKMDAYAHVSICCNDFAYQTSVDTVGDTNPTWNGITNMTFMVEKKSAEEGHNLTFDLRCLAPNGGYYDIGKVSVKVKDLMGAIDGSLVYPVQTPSGNHKGTLNFMFKWADERGPTAQNNPGYQQTKNNLRSSGKSMGKFLVKAGARALAKAVGTAVAEEVIHDVVHIIQNGFGY